MNDRQIDCGTVNALRMQLEKFGFQFFLREDSQNENQKDASDRYLLYRDSTAVHCRPGK
jgi:hypothetical protein